MSEPEVVTFPCLYCEAVVPARGEAAELVKSGVVKVAVCPACAETYIPMQALRGYIPTKSADGTVVLWRRDPTIPYPDVYA